MDEVFDRVGGRFRISITDSTMMRILHCAMDKSHERAKSKEGFLERLSEISKFYQLAVIQLEGCLKFIQEETDHNGFESGDEEVLADLTDIRDRLAGRLKESEIAISEKDRELKERLENEWTMRQALELKERKLDSLRKNLELERTKSEGIEELILGNRVSVDEERDEHFSELKSSVEQQVWNIKQKLDPDYIDRRSYQNFDDIKIEQMSSDIDVLKETMDIAFGKMHCAMILSELEPVEQQWGWMIEKDVMDVLFKGFLEDIHGKFQAEFGRREMQFSIGLSNYLSDLERELHFLQAELDPHISSQHSPERKNSLKAKGRSSSEEAPDGSSRMLEDEGDSHYVAKMIKNHESIIRRKSEEINSLKREIVKERRHSSSREEKEPISPRRKIRDVFTILDNLLTWNAKLGGKFNHSGEDGGGKIYSEKLLSEFSMTDQVKSQFDTLEDVWQKLNRNSICQAAETEDLKTQISNLKMEKEDVNVQKMITEMVHTTLLGGLMHDSRSELNCLSLKLAESEKIYEDSLKEMVTRCNEEMETEETEFQNREEIHCVVFGEVVNDFSSVLNYALTESQHLRTKSISLEDDALEEKLTGEISRICFKEMSDEWNDATKTSVTESFAKQETYQTAFEDEKLEIERIEFQNREEIYCVVLSEVVNDLRSSLNYALTESQHLRAKTNSLVDDSLEENLKGEMSIICFKEMSDEWNDATKTSKTECLAKQETYQIAFEDEKLEIETIEFQIREEIYCVIFGAVVSDLSSSLNYALTESQHLRANCNSLRDDSLEEKLKEQISIICFREMSSELNESTKRCETEHLAKQKIYRIAFEETITELINTGNKMQEAYLETLIREETCQLILLEAVKEANEACGEKILIQKQNLQKKYYDEENLILNSGSERKECSAISVAKNARELLNEIKCSSTSASGEIGKASEQLDMSKRLLSLLRSSLNIAVERIERSDEMSPNRTSITNKTFYFEQRGSEELMNSLDYNKLLQAFVNFKSTVQERLDINTSRLEKIMHQLNPIAEFIASLKSEVWIYRKAFDRRCENLRIAEIEVDLLGDQVELLIDLLEKIYKALHYHSPDLRQYFDVSNILTMIENGLAGVHASNKRHTLSL